MFPGLWVAGAAGIRSDRAEEERGWAKSRGGRERRGFRDHGEGRGLGEHAWEPRRAINRPKRPRQRPMPVEPLPEWNGGGVVAACREAVVEYRSSS
ncbi:hypothetical protein EX30DRAFT_92639 [Ascodesmis nigricans]|uniref:Uncharacterized protein n=1 Tax=Ascodesmis nigricans TaxID=341454 RepID=A0A4S2N3I5_9PEZI|nr:hypothetical protein EX30DRAFT_92639 [Ascodesmis nigricans]